MSRDNSSLKIEVLKTFSQFEDKIPNKWRKKGQEHYWDFREAVGKQLIKYRDDGLLPTLPATYRKNDKRDERWRNWLRQLDYGKHTAAVERFDDQISYDLKRGDRDGMYASLVYYRLHADLDNPKYAEAIDRVVFNGDTLAELDFLIFETAAEEIDSEQSDLLSDDRPMNSDAVNSDEPANSERIVPKPLYVRAGVALLMIFGLVAGVLFLWPFQVDQTSELPESKSKKLSIQQELNLKAAWDGLFRKMGGDTGKGKNLSEIISVYPYLDDIDLSCKNIGVWSDGKCVSKPILRSVKLGKKSFFDSYCAPPNCGGNGAGSYSYSVLIRNVNFSNTKLRDWDVYDMNFDGVDFTNAQGKRLFFKDTYFVDAKWDGFSCDECAFSNMFIPLSFLNLSESIVLSDIWVLFKSKSDIDTERLDEEHTSGIHNYWVRAPVNAPPIFKKGDVANLGYEHEDHLQSDFSVGDERVYWKLYQYVDFCIPTSIAPSVLGFSSKEKFEAEHGEGNESILDFVKPIDGSSYQLGAEDEKYICEFRYEQVKSYVDHAVLKKLNQ